MSNKEGLLPTSPQLMTAMKEIMSWTEKDVPKVPEAVFIEHMLPILVNTTAPQDLSWWMQIAGSLHRPIDVVGHNDEVLFRVPALQNRPAPPPLNSGRNSVFETMAVARQKNDVIPGHGDHYLKNTLRHRVEPVKSSRASLVEWNAIRARYGYPPVGTTADTAAPVVEVPTPTPSIPSDFFDGGYEEL